MATVSPFGSTTLTGDALLAEVTGWRIRALFAIDCNPTGNAETPIAGVLLMECQQKRAFS
jgi:hypothetical protein